MSQSFFSLRSCRKTAKSVTISPHRSKPRAAFACMSASARQVQEKFEERDLQVHYVTEACQDERMSHSN